MINEKNRGFSLIELLVAIAVMSIIMVMVVQMMGSSSVILRKTNKKLELQTEALEFREQFSDIIMQATYIRVQSEDNNIYSFDTGLDDSNNRRKRVAGSTGNITGDLVSDSYPDYIVAGDNDFDIYMNSGTYTLYGVDSAKDRHPATDDPTIQSMRILSKSAGTGSTCYIKPAYVYVRYQIDKAAKTEQYAIFRFVNGSNGYKVYADKGTITDIDTTANDGFNTAKASVNAKADNNGLMSDKVKDAYFSADTDSNSVYIDMQFENAKYTNQTYEYRDVITLRNTNALTVPPSKMFLKKTSP